jgi:DNA-binding NarL/FixJ family response regulator
MTKMLRPTCNLSTRFMWSNHGVNELKSQTRHRHSPKAPKRIRVLICNKHALFRAGIKALLNDTSHFEIVGEAGTGRQALHLVDQVKPDVVLMDAVTPDLSGSEATRRIKAVHPEVKVLILTLYEEDEPLIAGCLKAGASGYFRKYDHSFRLKSAISTVCRAGARAA